MNLAASLPVLLIESQSPNLVRITPRRSERMMQMTRHLDQRELAKRWAMSPRTLERWRWSGDGPRFIKVGGRRVYRLEDIEAYEAERLHESTQRRTSPPPAGASD
jgi:hypothetical protein